MASMIRVCELEDPKLPAILADFPGFPEVKALRKEQETCIVNFAPGKCFYDPADQVRQELDFSALSTSSKYEHTSFATMATYWV